MPRTVISDTTTTNPDGSTMETIVYDDGSTTTTLVPAANSPAANQQTLTAKVTQAIAANITFIGLASPTNAQVIAQAKAQARQWNALAKIVLGQLDDTTGT